MARPKKIKEVIETTPEVVEVTEVIINEEVSVESAESTEKKAFRLLIEKYKEQNPVKYELKKEAFEAKLKSL